MSANITQTDDSITESLRAKGYVIIPSFLSPTELETLRTAASELTTLARGGNWHHVRTLPRQFPPWPKQTPTNPLPIWGVQHLLHPSLPSTITTPFLNLYFSPRLLTVSSLLISSTSGSQTPVTPDSLTLELLNLLVAPPEPFTLRWHRDDIPWTADPQSELAILARPTHHTQWNLPLFPDSSLLIIPGSHKRARTEAERCAGEYDPLEGETRVVLKAGDIVFYDNNILHRGVYDIGAERLTMHGSVGSVHGRNDRARNVLQHGVGEWVSDVDFSCLDERQKQIAEGMRQRLVEMGRGTGEYSLDG